MSEQMTEKKKTTRKKKETIELSENAQAIKQFSEAQSDHFPVLPGEALNETLGELLSADEEDTILKAASRAGGEKIVDALTALATQQAANALAKLDMEETPKSLRKASRTALFKLKAKGIEPDENALTPTQAIVEMSKIDRPWLAWLSATDGAGYRLTLLAKPYKTGDYLMLFAFEDEKTGLYNAYQEQVTDPNKFAETYRKGFKEENYLFAPIDAEYGRLRAAAAFSKTLERHEPLPGDAPYWKASLPINEPLPPHPVWERYGRQTIENEPGLLAESQKLISISGLRGWYFEVAQIRPFTYQMVDAMESKIEVSEAVKEERMEKIFADAAESLFPPEVAQNYKQRLEDIAYLWSQRGEDEQRIKQALAAALSFEKEPRYSPFAKILVKMSIAIYLERMKRGEVF